MIPAKYLKSENFFQMRGVYTLVLHLCTENVSLRVGKLGKFKLRGGYYLYTGSALGKGALSLGGRIRRHLKKQKVMRWHIDYLLSLKEVNISSIVLAEVKEKIECELNWLLKKKIKGRILIPNFGSSDCKFRCGSHLLYVGKGDPLQKVVDIYKTLTFNVIILKESDFLE